MYNSTFMVKEKEANRSLQNLSVEVLEKRCSRCKKGTTVTDTESGEVVCQVCGCVISERLVDSGPEYRYFQDGSPDKSRTGMGISLTRHDKGLSTIINPANKDAVGNYLSYSMKNTLWRLRRLDSRSQAHKSSAVNFRQAFSELNRLKDKLGLPDAVIEKSAYIYRKAIDKRIIQGRSISALISASLYAACRDAETPRTIGDISEASNVKRKQITKCYGILLQKLDLRIPVINAIQCVTRIANILGLPEKTKRYAIEILKEYQKSGDSDGKSPMGLAATALYLACTKMNENLTQKEIAKAANITEVTIRNRSKAMKNTLNLTVRDKP